MPALQIRSPPAQGPAVELLPLPPAQALSDLICMIQLLLFPACLLKVTHVPSRYAGAGLPGYHRGLSGPYARTDTLLTAYKHRLTRKMFATPELSAV
jgi:hypothetical protein